MNDCVICDKHIDESTRVEIHVIDIGYVRIHKNCLVNIKMLMHEPIGKGQSWTPTKDFLDSYDDMCVRQLVKVTERIKDIRRARNTLKERSHVIPVLKKRKDSG